MKIRRATAKDTRLLTDFFNHVSLPGDVELQTHRRDVFSPYHLQGPDFATYLLENEQGGIEAMATLVFRPGTVMGEAQTIGYATDLRVSNSRRAVLNWSHHFLPVLEEEKQRRGCKLVFSVVAQMQRQAYNAFIRPRLSRRHLPRYHLFRSFDILSIHGFLPLSPRPLSTILLRQGSSHDLTAVCEYIARKNRQSPLTFSLSPQDVARQMASWPGLNLNHFILAFDAQRRLIGCVAPWSPAHVQEISVQAYHSRAKVLHDSLIGLSWLRLARRLPDPGEALNVLFLTHLHADNPDVFYSLLRASFAAAGRSQFLAYPHFAGDLVRMPPRSLIAGRIRCGLYCVLPPTEPPPDFITTARRETPPEFELAWL